MVSAAFGTVTGALDRRFVPGFCIMHRGGIDKAVTLSVDSAQRQECRVAKYLLHVRTEQEDLFTSTHRRDDLTSTPESICTPAI